VSVLPENGFGQVSVEDPVFDQIGNAASRIAPGKPKRPVGWRDGHDTDVRPTCHDRGHARSISPLHVGSGEHEDDDAIALSEQDRERLGMKDGNPESARVVARCQWPALYPGTSIKGVLRRRSGGGGPTDAESAKDTSVVEALFGDIKNDGRGRSARSPSLAPNCSGRRLRAHARPLPARTRPGQPVWRWPRVPRSSRGAASSEDRKLFYAEEIVPGGLLQLPRPLSASELPDRKRRSARRDRLARAAQDLLGRLLGLLDLRARHPRSDAEPPTARPRAPAHRRRPDRRNARRRDRRLQEKSGIPIVDRRGRRARSAGQKVRLETALRGSLLCQ